jgi:hypothetical protein
MLYQHSDARRRVLWRPEARLRDAYRPDARRQFASSCGVLRLFISLFATLCWRRDDTGRFTSIVENGVSRIVFTLFGFLCWRRDTLHRFTCIVTWNLKARFCVIQNLVSASCYMVCQDLVLPKSTLAFLAYQLNAQIICANVLCLL